MTPDAPLPEGLMLVLDEHELKIEDPQDIVHVRFEYGLGDPTAWSASIATLTCQALGVTVCIDLDDHGTDDRPVTVPELIKRWHAKLSAYEGFLE